MAPQLLFCLLFLTCCCTVTLAQMPHDCCLAVKNKEIDKRAVVNYHRQIAGRGCSVDATILVTKGGRNLCVPLDEPWVLAVIDHVNRRREACRKTNYRGSHCKHMKSN